MFEIIDFLIVNPIVNILFVIYNLVGDFGVAIIIFTVLVKLLMWPLVKKQLNQTKLMRKIQPELTEIRKRCNGNKQMESLQTMDLYKRNNIKPMSSITTLLIQLPIFFALFLAIRTIATPTVDVNISSRAYPITAELPRIKELTKTQNKYIKEITAYNDNKNSSELSEEEKNKLEAPRYDFYPQLFGVVDLSAYPGFASQSSVIILIFAVLSAFMQYLVSKIQMPNKKKKGAWKRMMEDAKAGKDPDQNELNEFVSGQMSFMMPVMMLFIILQFQGAIVLYYLVTNTISVLQYKIMLDKVDKKLDDNTDRAILKELKDKTKQIQEAEVIHNEKTGTNITRIKARDAKSNKKSTKNKNSQKPKSQSGKG